MLDNSKEQNTRTLQAIIICIFIALIWSNLNQPPRQAAPAGEQQQQESQGGAAAPAVQVQSSAPQQVTLPSAGQAAKHPSRAELEAAKSAVVNTGVSQVLLSRLGGRVLSLKLQDYKTQLHSEEGLDLIDNPDGTSFPLGLYAGSESDERVMYSLVSINGAPASEQSPVVTVPQGSTASLELKGTLPSGSEVTKKITFRGGSYLFSVDAAVSRRLPDGQALWLEWAQLFPASAESGRNAVPHITLLEPSGKIKQVGLSDVVEAARGFGASKWAALGNLYFMSTIIPLAQGSNTVLGREGEVYFAREPGGSESGRFEVYSGPKDYKMLQYVGDYHLERSIDLGWFSFLALPLLWLLHYLYLYLHNYGMAIIALTLIVKTALLPLSKASFASMKKMQEVQPEIKALRERIKDSTQLNQEMLALYQRRGINPMGGCFPIAIQIPVFLGLYNALSNSIELRHAGFALWITDLSAPERLEMFGIGVPVMVLLMSASMIIQQWTTPNPSADPQQQKMMMMMPIIFAIMFIVYPMPAGLVLYWLVNNIISITQQVYMRNTEKGSVYMATFVVSMLTLAGGYILTLI